MSGSGSHVGSAKQKKAERRATEQRLQTLQAMSDRIGRLEDRDTQQQAFQALVTTLPQLSSSLVGEFYSLVERNKRPSRCSTRRMLVLLVAALCRCHPRESVKLLPRITAYIGTRLRDNEAAVTEACGILVSALALHVVPLCFSDGTSTSEPEEKTSADKRAERWRRVFETVAAPLAKDANAIGENATRCLCALLRPTEFDGHSLPSRETLLAHATRVRLFFVATVNAAVAKMNGSTMYASFSSVFLVLKAACEAATEAHERAGVSELSQAIAPLVGFIVESIEDVFRYGPREDWVLRKRGTELLALLIEGFALSEHAFAESAVAFFQTHLAATRAVVAFDKLNRRHGGVSPAKGAPLPIPYSPTTYRAGSPDRRSGARKHHQYGDHDALPVGAQAKSTEHSAPADTNGADTLLEAQDFDDFVAKKRLQVSSERRKRLPRLSPPKATSEAQALESFAFRFDDDGGDTNAMPEDPAGNEPTVGGPVTAALGTDQDEAEPEEGDDFASMSRADAALRAAECEEFELAFRLCLLEDDARLLRQVMGVVGAPCMQQLSRMARSALCAAFLELLDDGIGATGDLQGTPPSTSKKSRGGDGGDRPDEWLVFAWLRELGTRRASVAQIDPRVLRALEQRLRELSASPTSAGLEAARVLALLGQ
ncbi:hypothetical protein PybrP1_006956 [[Pythium] brassicae (nom. inval.)]|nr:hypothetical protein PybrP1_006956 [[Pythium] brassicae (nom. inval.)]